MIEIEAEICRNTLVVNKYSRTMITGTISCHLLLLEGMFTVPRQITRSTLLGPGRTWSELDQSCPNVSWPRLNKVLETFLKVCSYTLNSIKHFLQVFNLDIHVASQSVNLPLNHTHKIAIQIWWLGQTFECNQCYVQDSTLIQGRIRVFMSFKPNSDHTGQMFQQILSYWTRKLYFCLSLSNFGEPLVTGVADLVQGSMYCAFWDALHTLVVMSEVWLLFQFSAIYKYMIKLNLSYFCLPITLQNSGHSTPTSGINKIFLSHSLDISLFSDHSL